MSDAEDGVPRHLLASFSEAPRSGSECLGGRTRQDAAGVTEWNSVCSGKNLAFSVVVRWFLAVPGCQPTCWRSASVSEVCTWRDCTDIDVFYYQVLMQISTRVWYKWVLNNSTLQNITEKQTQHINYHGQLLQPRNAPAFFVCPRLSLWIFATTSKHGKMGATPPTNTTTSTITCT